MSVYPGLVILRLGLFATRFLLVELDDVDVLEVILGLVWFELPVEFVVFYALVSFPFVLLVVSYCVSGTTT